MRTTTIARRSHRATVAGIALVGALAATGCAAAAEPAPGPVELSSAAGVAPSLVPERVPSGLPAPPPSVDGEYRVLAGEAGTVTFAVAGQRVDLVDVALEPGWRQAGEYRQVDEVEVVILGERDRVVVKAETDDGRFDSDVDIDVPADPAQRTYQAADAGTVTVDISPARVGLVGHQAAPGWIATVDERELHEGEVKIFFRNDTDRRSVEFDAEIDDGWMNVDIDSRTGPDHFVRPSAR
ncbi:MAG: hypothetical protein ACT4RN_05730 [Pseudonocardia sp.]